MANTPQVYHAFLRPSILQILRATGYHSTRPAVLDLLTDLAARYLALLCEATASHASHNQEGQTGDFDLADVRMALQDAGALLPQRVPSQEDWVGEEDVRGVDEFIKWFSGGRMKAIMDFGKGDGEVEATDYLGALKKKHNKTGEDTKYQGTLFGKANDEGETQVLVEGGPEMSISEWITKRSRTHHPEDETHQEEEVTEADKETIARQGLRSPSSGLSSVGSRLGAEDVLAMDLS